MRRRSFNRPKEKLRGVTRRLRAIDQWANSFQGYFPIEHVTEKYWNWKIPVLDRLVCPPTTNDNLQAHCAAAMLRAAEHLVAAKPKELNNAVVTVLLTYPDMFGSELCIFFDKEYFDGFFERSNEYEALVKREGVSLSSKLNLKMPSSFDEVGFSYKNQDEWEGEVITYEEQWWSFREHSHG